MWIFIYSQIGAIISTVHFRTFSSYQKQTLNMLAINSKSLSHLNPKQPWIYFVCVDFSSLDFPMNGIISYVVFCDWLLSQHIFKDYNFLEPFSSVLWAINMGMFPSSFSLIVSAALTSCVLLKASN